MHNITVKLTKPNLLRSRDGKLRVFMIAGLPLWVIRFFCFLPLDNIRRSIGQEIGVGQFLGDFLKLFTQVGQLLLQTFFLYLDVDQTLKRNENLRSGNNGGCGQGWLLDVGTGVKILDPNQRTEILEVILKEITKGGTIDANVEVGFFPRWNI